MKIEGIRSVKTQHGRPQPTVFDGSLAQRCSVHVALSGEKCRAVGIILRLMEVEVFANRVTLVMLCT